jgi:hypothetical protein
VQFLGNLGERQRFLVGEDLEDRLEGAVAARPMQAELVAVAAPGGEHAVRGEQRRQRRDGIAGAASARRRVAQRADVGRAPVGQGLDGPAQEVAVCHARIRRGRQHAVDFAGRERGQVNDLEACRRIAQQSMRAGGVA